MQFFRVVIVFLGLLVCLSSASAADRPEPATDSGKLDRLIEGQGKVLEKQDKIIEKQERIYAQVTPSNPLAGKKYGIEFNPAYYFLASGNNDTVLSGGISFFGIDRQAEIAIPIYYGDFGASDGLSDAYRIFTVDAHYRYFLGPVQDGWYVSGGARYARIEGNSSTGYPRKKITADKLGLAFGVGYRVFSSKNIYWGTSLIVGRYYTGTDKEFEAICLDCEKTLIDMELLKFGYAF